MYRIEYYNRYVLDAIEEWPSTILADYARILELLMTFGSVLRMPYSRALGKGLFELRPRGREGTARVFYCYLNQRRIVILHTVVKKTQRLRQSDVALARRRMMEVIHG